MVIGGAFIRNSSGQSKASALSAPSSPVILVDGFRAQFREVQDSCTISGQIEPMHAATISSEVPDRVVARPVQRGDKVTSGQPIALLFSGSAEASRSQAVGALEQAEAAVRQAEAQYKQAVVETASNVESAGAQVDAALADERRARADEAQALAGQRKTARFTRQQELLQAQAALSEARTQENLARTERDRNGNLAREGAVSIQTFDRAQAAFESAESRRVSAEQAVSLAMEGARKEDRDSAEASVQAAKAQVASAQQRVQEARAVLKSAQTRDLRLAEIRTQIEGLQAQQAQAAQNVRQAEIALAKHTVRAPFTGRVLETVVDVGDMVAVGSPVAKIGRIDRVKATFSAPEAIRPSLELGSNFGVTADALGARQFRGRITALGFQADAHTREFPLEITIDNRQERLLPNMVARISLPWSAKIKRLVVPFESVMADPDGTSSVFVISQGRAHRREVRTGVLTSGSVEIASGLAVGETIARTPQRLSDGALVELR
jgi:RND family efflux transporter MFP subunit